MPVARLVNGVVIYWLVEKSKSSKLLFYMYIIHNNRIWANFLYLTGFFYMNKTKPILVTYMYTLYFGKCEWQHALDQNDHVIYIVGKSLHGVFQSRISCSCRVPIPAGRGVQGACVWPWVVLMRWFFLHAFTGSLDSLAFSTLSFSADT